MIFKMPVYVVNKNIFTIVRYKVFKVFAFIFNEII